eukprot:evm.model.scf_1083.5 EVM.evm.TU.scf_1083.5   scf_1083:48497-52568(-)
MRLPTTSLLAGRRDMRASLPAPLIVATERRQRFRFDALRHARPARCPDLRPAGATSNSSNQAAFQAINPRGMSRASLPFVGTRHRGRRLQSVAEDSRRGAVESNGRMEPDRDSDGAAGLAPDGENAIKAGRNGDRRGGEVLGESSKGAVENGYAPPKGGGDEARARGAGMSPSQKVEEEEWMEEGVAWVPHRWKVTALMCIAFILCNMDKVNMSVAVIPMAGELGWSATSRGIVQSAFFWGYTLTQIPAGWISTRVGGPLVLLAGVAIWSLGTLVAPLAAHLGFFWLCASRVLVGLGEGFAPSAATSVLAKQVPVTERSRAVSTVFGGLDLGSAIGLLLCGPLIRLYGWPCVFYLFATFGLVWCLVWPLAKPEKRDWVMRGKALREAKRLAARAEQNKGDENKVPWGEFLQSAPVWAVTTAHFCFNWGYYTLLSWLPSYFELALNLDIQNSSFLTVIPYLSMTAMTPLVGPAADALVGKGWSVTHVRKLSQGIAFLGPALCMVTCGLLTSKGAAALPTFGVGALVGLLSVAFALGAWSRAGLYCNHQDLSSRYASALLGISNTAGAVPGILGVWSTGYLLDLTGSWPLALFYPIAACQLFGLLVYTVCGSSKKQPWS